MHSTETMDQLIAGVRLRLSKLLANGAPTRETARLLADLEEEQTRRDQIDDKLQARAAALETAAVTPAGASSVFDRPLPAELDDRAGVPRSHRAPTDDERARGVVVSYTNANPTFYRAVIERLQPGEKFRIETAQGTFEMTRDEFETALPAMARSASYRRGTDGAPGAARYVTARVPRTIDQYRVR